MMCTTLALAFRLLFSYLFLHRTRYCSIATTTTAATAKKKQLSKSNIESFGLFAIFFVDIAHQTVTHSFKKIITLSMKAQGALKVKIDCDEKHCTCYKTSRLLSLFSIITFSFFSRFCWCTVLRLQFSVWVLFFSKSICSARCQCSSNRHRISGVFCLDRFTFSQRFQ